MKPLRMQSLVIEAAINGATPKALNPQVPHICPILSGYTPYYNCARTHLAPDKDAPASRRIQGRDPSDG